MSATARGTAWPALSSFGKATTPMKPAVADRSRSEPQTASSATSSSIRATIQASSANATEFFNILLAEEFGVSGNGPAKVCDRMDVLLNSIEI